MCHVPCDVYHCVILCHFQVQQDLLSLKEKLMTQKCDFGDTRGHGQFDISALENAIKTTEDGIKVSVSYLNLY